MIREPDIFYTPQVPDMKKKESNASTGSESSECGSDPMTQSWVKEEVRRQAFKKAAQLVDTALIEVEMIVDGQP